MKDKLIEIIYEEIKNKNLYNYDNDEKLKNVTIEIYTNILQEKVIDICLEHEVYTITAIKSFADREGVE